MAARFCTEPLITIDNDGKIFPVLAAEVPSTQNGGLAADGKSVTYKLKPGIKWADGQPFSADDVAFTYQFIADPASSAVTAGTYANIDKVEAVDPAPSRSPSRSRPAAGSSRSPARTGRSCRSTS